jgi:DNA-binding NarL/FixJ family response regulator
LPDTKILVVSQWDSEVAKRRAFTAGASGYVTKDKASRELISEVRRILHERNA